ncbi:MAG: uroporphyrinogen decarboxylase [Actinomycetes bacterium]
MDHVTLSATHPLNSSTADSALVLAARQQRGEVTPVWFMRQAGRSLPEYRALREGVAMLDSCFNTDLIVEITLQPVRRHHVDAAIFFSDIVVPLKAIGVDLDIVPGRGPVMAKAVQTSGDVAALRELEPDDVASVLDAVGALAAELGATPLIGFAGAPFTLASYLIEGGPSRDHLRTKAFMYGQPELWHELCGRLARIAGRFLALQVEHGASAIQLFDSWVGALSAVDYERFVLPHSQAALAMVPAGVPKIHFGVGTGELLPLMGSAGADVLGVDFRVPLDVAAARVGNAYALQGNLDPALLFAPWQVVEASVREVMRRGDVLSGHIFNLGHGVPPETDPDVLTRVVELVHEISSQ